MHARRAADGMSATLTVRDAEEAGIAELARSLDADVESEGLGLEDIFLEIHQ
jgi:hypothetical protein